MRLRKVKNAAERLVAPGRYYVENPKDFKGKWAESFANPSNPIHIEIGCGKGQFMRELATRNPDINYIAIEKFDSVLLRALEKCLEVELPNLKLTLMDAAEINEYFAENEVDRIYLNFSDPWPKKKHHKYRLTAPSFLSQYQVILKPEGAIHQKTDNRFLFEFSLESFCNNGWKLENVSLDLHKDIEKYPFNITTEFEDKWSKLGPIYRLEATKK